MDSSERHVPLRCTPVTRPDSRVERAIDGIRHAIERYLSAGYRVEAVGGTVHHAEAPAVFEAMPSQSRACRTPEDTGPPRLSAGDDRMGAIQHPDALVDACADPQGSEGNRAAIVLNREAVVRRTLASPAFDRLAA